jgi:hypothetical protein
MQNFPLSRSVAVVCIFLLACSFVLSIGLQKDTHVNSSRSTKNGFASGNMPSELQMDNDVATVPSTSSIQVSPLATSISATDIEIAVDIVSLQSGVVVLASATSIITRQHALRI